jgi:hypothetical protein
VNGGASELEREALAAAQMREALLPRAARRALGVVHTPLPLVQCALARVERALAQDFGIAQGLASPRVCVLDPALGSGVWLAALLARLHGRGAPAGLLGFDSDAAALQDAAALLHEPARAQGVALTLHAGNTLAQRDPWPAGDALRVILGNPPWGARSLSRGLALSDAQLREFLCDAAGQPLAERRSGVLSDDYVRFFAWALAQARSAPAGAVVCLVTNGSYLEGPVHRGMRAALCRTFESIELIDLGGNPRTSRGEERDEAVFPVRLGAALALLVRGGRRAGTSCHVSYVRLSGRRADKLAALSGALPAERVFAPRAPWFRFRPPARSAPEPAGFGLHEAFPFHREGVQTNRDALATAPTRELLLARLWQIARGELALAGARHFDPQLARTRLLSALERDPEACIGRLWYRPCEERAYVALAPLCHRPRPGLARAAAGSRLCLLSTRKEPGAARWNMFGAVRGTAESSFLSARSACRTRVFPSHGPEGEPNLDAALAARLGELLGSAPTPEQLIAYALGVLGAPRFRAEQEEQLRHDYARLPWPRDATLFGARVRAGERFVRLLDPAPLPLPEALALEGELPPEQELERAQLRWLAPNRIQIAQGAEIGAGAQDSLRAQVGHHRLVELAYGARGRASVAQVLSACARALLWSEAEKCADASYLV